MEKLLIVLAAFLKKTAERFYAEREAHFKEMGIDMRELERAMPRQIG